MEPLTAAMNLYRSGHARDAESLCERLLRSCEDRVDVRMLLAEIQMSTGRVDAALAHLSVLVRLQPDNAAAHRRLGGAFMSLGKTADAIAALRRAVELEPENVRGQNNLGQALLQAGQFPEAVRRFERALALNPTYAIGHHNLALALEKSGQFPQALHSYELSLTLQPGNPDAWAARGALLARCNRALAALECFEEAARRRPDAQILLRKAAVLLVLGRAAEAIAIADQALDLQPDLIEALNVKAGALSRLRRPTEALSCLVRALELCPTYLEGWCSRAIVHQQLADTEAATRCHRHALALDPDCIEARTGLLSGLIPAIPMSALESARARQALQAGLADLEAWLQGRDLDPEERWTLAKQQFFYLSYQEESNKPLLQRYRQGSAARLAQWTDEVAKDEPISPVFADGPRRMRLGIVSAHVADHSVFNAILRGWLERLDGGTFEKTLFSLGTTYDEMTRAAVNAVDRVDADSKTLAEWAQVIGRHRLDVLIYPEVGMDRSTLALANLRLANRQCAAWGHPETTGLPTIDHYLSADAFEPADAQEHYSETLVRLPNLGVYYRPYDLVETTVDLPQLGIEHGGPLFVCPGSPFKYRPEHDWILVEIARRVGSATFVFFAHERVEFSHKLQRRLSAAFAAAGLDARHYLKCLPWLSRSVFLGFLRQADVYLDTIGFSGFNTLMQAVQAHLPSVAHQGRFMRGRLGSGILTKLGLTELVARTPRDYIEIAVELATQREYRDRVRRQMQSAEHGLYGDLSAVAALSDFLSNGSSGNLA